MDSPKSRDVRKSGEDVAFVKGQRIGAFALDALVILLAWVLGFVLALAGYADRVDLTQWALAWCILFPILYSGLMEWATGTTIGKHAMRLMVRDIHGRRLSLGHAFGRAICKGGACFPLLMPITLLFTCFGPRGWTLHDWLAGTVVMLNDDRPPPSIPEPMPSPVPQPLPEGIAARAGMREGDR